MTDPATRTTYLVVDGENIDATLGTSILKRRPAPAERPRWDRVLHYCERVWGQPVKALFFLNASSGDVPWPFVQALVALGIRPIPLGGPSTTKVVDVAVQRTLEAIAQREADVVVASHDADFVDQVSALLTGTERRVALLGFAEYVSGAYTEWVDRGLEIFDLEDDAGAFNQPLMRIRIIDVDAFDPNLFL